MREVFFLSNRTAITSETMGYSLLAQFPQEEFTTVTIPFIDTVAKAEKVVVQINAAFDRTELVPIVFNTIAEAEINHVIKQSKALILDPFEQFLPRMEKVLHAHHEETSVQSHRMQDSELYDSRIEAIDFSLVHDDGGNTRRYDETDIIVIGVSRSGKTPSCLYLALQFGIKAANYPITEEDLDSDSLPERLLKYKDRLYGLTTDANRLRHIRQERRPDSRYSSLDQCRHEIRAVEEMYHRHRIPYLNTTTMSVEEIAARIVADTGLHRMETVLSK